MTTALTHIAPSAVHTFLTKCTRAPDRFYYPCNAKARSPQHCAYQLNTGSRGAVSVVVHECEYIDGGTGWRAWPCALLLACWLAAHEEELGLAERSVLELGCGLGLPGLAAAALGARRVALTDCLPKLLRTVADSCEACARLAAAQGGGAVAAQAALLDWEEEAAKAGGPAPDSGEQYSTEQGVKAAQLLALEADEAASPPLPRLADDERFELLLASDVIYSAGHAAMLPRVVGRRAAACAPGGAPALRLCAMVPVRCAEHTHAFLRGLQQQGMRVALARVSAAWVGAVLALQRTPDAMRQAPAMAAEATGAAAEAPKTETTAAPAQPPESDTRASVPYDVGTELSEGDIVFVEAWTG